MSERNDILTIRGALRGAWPMPALVAGLFCFVGALSHLAHSRADVTHEDRLRRIEILRAQGATERAVAYLTEQLRRLDETTTHRAEFAKLLAATVYERERAATTHSQTNARLIATHYESSRQWGATLDAREWVALGDAYRWSSRSADAVNAYREAIRLGAGGADRIRRILVELAVDSDGTLSARAQADLEAMLASESIQPGDFYFALEKRVENLLRAHQASAGLDCVMEAVRRLEGTEERPAVEYLRARCLEPLGRSDEADEALRELLTTWTVRDELWAEATAMRARLHQKDDRPQAALVLYEDVLRSFPEGALHRACLRGRAECLATLGEFEEALRWFAELCAEPGNVSTAADPDRSAAAKAAARWGETLLKDTRLDLAIPYLELALSEANRAARLPGRTPDTDSQIHLTTLLADAYARRFETRGSDRRAAKLDDAVRGDLVKSAELRLSLTTWLEGDELGSIRALEQAIEALDTAGQTERMIEELERYAATHPNGLWRSTALQRLGQAYQAQGRVREAAESYHDVITRYPRMPDALRSMVPLAQCLLAAAREGREDAKVLRQRGVELLLDIVDDRGEDQLFAPSASEYREALYRLAEHLSSLSVDDADADPEQAITRWESWLALYPDDPRGAQAAFYLAESYRRSAAGLRLAASSHVALSERSSFESEADRRTAQALRNYERVIGACAGRDATDLDDVQAMCLRLSYLHRGDCLLALGRLEEAISFSRETAWRYENTPTALSAMMQILFAQHQRGDVKSVAASLARARWLLARIPAAAFEATGHTLNQAQWQTWMTRYEKAGLDG